MHLDVLGAVILLAVRLRCDVAFLKYRRTCYSHNNAVATEPPTRNDADTAIRR